MCILQFAGIKTFRPTLQGRLRPSQSVEQSLMNRNLILLGLLIVLLGIFWPVLQKIPLGKLPGDIIIRKEGFRLYLPITSCLLVSGVLSVLFWLFRK